MAFCPITRSFESCIYFCSYLTLFTWVPKSRCVQRNRVSLSPARPPPHSFSLSAGNQVSFTVYPSVDFFMAANNVYLSHLPP